MRAFLAMDDEEADVKDAKGAQESNALRVSLV